jgi:N6-adenosine-specific RNA methylase IME4
MPDGHNITAGFHSLASVFPEIGHEDFEALKTDILANGLQESITLYEGKILDGRMRYQACISAGIEPTFRNLAAGIDPFAFLVSANLHRRHLTTGQRALIAARLPRIAHGSNRFKRIEVDKENSRAIPGMNRADRASVVRVDEKTVREAETVVDSGLPELIDRVERNLISIDVAAKVAKYTPERQALILADEGSDRVRTVLKQQRRAERELELADATNRASEGLLSDQVYAVLYADPPWRFEPWSPTGMDRAADNHYPTVTVDKLKAMTVPKAPTSILFLWATAPMLLEALAVMAAWGFAYKTHLVWAKDKVGTGYWARSRHELLLIGTRGDVPAPAMGLQPESVIEAPRGEHSVKPDEFRVIIEAMFPNCPRLEMFARTPREGWDSWGNEIDPPADSAS